MWAMPAIPKRRHAKAEPRMIFYVFFFMILIIIIVILRVVQDDIMGDFIKVIL